MTPPTATLTPGERRAVRVGFAVLAAIIAFAAVHSVAGFGGHGVEKPVRDWASSVVYAVVAAIVALRAIRVPEQRRAWTAIAAGVTLYGAGNLLWSLWLQGLESPPIPSGSDVLWLALYPCSYLGLVWLARIRGSRVPAGVWLDGIIAGLGISAVGAAVVFGPVLAAAEGDTVAVMTNLAYPIGDLLLAALVLGILALRGWRLDRQWLLLGCGFLILTVADCLYLLKVAGGATEASLVANVFYMAGVSLIAAAAWQRSAHATSRLTGGSMLVVPAAFVLAAVCLLVVDHLRRLDPLAFSLAAATMLAASVRIALAFRDLRALAETRRQALTDDLTELPNRRLLLQRLSDELEAARSSEAPVALLIVDLDNFKELNDTLGHSVGDELLREVGPRLAGELGEHDTLARLGGDEFGILLAAPADEDAAALASVRLLRALERPFPVANVQLPVAASIGIAVHRAHDTTADELLRRADIAMYQAKRLRSGHEIYHADRDEHSIETMTLIGQLPAALATGAVETHFQLKAEAGTGVIVGAEALVRWRHPERGLLAPAAFVPAAEQAGLGRDLTRCVLGQALRQCRAWLDAGRDLSVAVNTTVADLLDTSLPAEVGMALHDAGVPADRLIVEVTESSVLADPVRAGHVLQQLRDLGVEISLDDFGTGYSSLAHLRTLPVDEVKLDRSFVGTMREDPVAAAIVRSTVQLAAALGVSTVAEGVEDEETWAAVAATGCDLIQGYHLSRPLPAAELEPLLRDRPGPGSRRGRLSAV